MAVGAVVLGAGQGRAGVLDASWNAPVANTDGTPLTDLAYYRVYYGTSGSPCPSGTFVQVTSSTASPLPGQRVSVRLTNLTTGTLYTVSVTAVDSGGMQSACSESASATAQASFTVTPAAGVSFGNVNVGGSATQTFVVQNSRGGTVTGTVTSSGPFSVPSGTPFTLTGSGASQTVTIRFAPTAPAVASASVVFRADGDTVSRSVTGVGVAVDTVAPAVTITSPTSNSTLNLGSASLVLAGTASDNVGVTQVTWSSNRGGSGVATGTTSWTTGSIALSTGQNVLTVTARDQAGNTATDTLTVNATPTSFTFTDDPVVPQITVVRVAHLLELRAAVNSIRTSRGLSAFAWTDASITAGGTPIKAIHLTELRTALAQAYQAAGRVPPTFTDPGVALAGAPIRAVHLNELRAAVRGL